MGACDVSKLRCKLESGSVQVVSIFFAHSIFRGASEGCWVEVVWHWPHGASAKSGLRDGFDFRQPVHLQVYRKPKTSKPTLGRKIYPYLLRNQAITRPNQVWAMDISYIPMAHGFVYLTAVIDWYSRRVVSWKLSNTMDVSFCLEALDEALDRYSKPEIFNTDQGSQFTSVAFTDRLKQAGIAISMDGKGRWVDNVFVERFWRSLKYEEVYLHAYESVPAARAGIGRYIEFFNQQRPHSSLNRQTPNQIYFNRLPEALVA